MKKEGEGKEKEEQKCLDDLLFLALDCFIDVGNRLCGWGEQRLLCLCWLLTRIRG